ncbi:GntR domain protein [Alkaliphilus metalliredigens QYMF]|uniref:GntR domain protein n=1 Tax=Alkaliphilus metalliredigens (strain QYMF) TaxID=293826 RepID=A6TMQ1_ALKMQ|nr:FadR/GntR family transcriptional regulator [Alkaliphilus metalliredigens]ABR47469.1 GntR domain protein [Alkaliphilus metalliredigens QYMF]
MERPRGNIGEYVYKIMEERIISGEWKPGTKITPETQLAKELNVSRMSIREAIERMVALNLVIKKHGEGTYVNQVTPSVYFNSLIPMITLERDNYLDILEFRLIVEVESAMLCAQRRDPDIIVQLEECYEEMLGFQEQPEKFTVADMNFHMTIAEGTGNTLIIKINQVLKSLLEYHQKVLYEHLGPTGGIKEHKEILEAIRSGDQDLSGLYMKRHIERTITDLKKIKR